MVCWLASEFTMKHQTRFAILSLLILIAFFGQSVTAQEKVKFSVGVGTETIGTNMFLLGTKKGFFDEFGLEVQPILLRGSSNGSRARLSIRSSTSTTVICSRRSKN
jgi:hypothetical protein